MMQKKETDIPSEASPRRRRVAILIIAAILALILILGAVLGIVLLVREAGALISYNGITISEGVVSYILSTEKANYLRSLRDSGVDAIDSAQFWQSEYKDGVSYKQNFSARLESYIRWVAVSAYLFDRYSALDNTEREWIGEKTREVLELQAGGNVASFNKEAEPMGFTYDDFCSATELLYKAERAVEAVYGKGGVGIATEANRSILEKHLESYTHVKILYIRRQDKFLLDEKGNRVVENGRDVLISLTDSEKAERINHIYALTDAIEALKTGSDGRINETYFDSFYRYYNDEPEYAESGYYLKEGSAYTEWYREEVFGEVVEAALSMEVGEFRRVDLDDMAVFLCCTECPKGAYAAYGLENFFTDFYKTAASSHLREMTDALIPEVTVKNEYYNINPVKIFQNTKFKIR